MAISGRIQAMYTHTSDIYDSVELTGVDTTDIDKNLVNVPNTLKEGYIDIINNGTDTLYNNFPKVSGEGTSLTLNNTYQAPMRNNLKGNTSQTGTPTPTSPIPVNVVSGDNDIVVNSKNLITFDKLTDTTTLNITKIFENNIIKLNGTSNNSGNLLPSTSLGIGIASGTYTLTYKIKNGTYTLPDNYADVSLTLKNAESSIVATSLSSISASGVPKSTTFTIENYNNLYLSMYANRTGIILNNLELEVQLEKGSSASEIEPYQGNTYNIDLPVENLLDTQYFQQGSIDSTTGQDVSSPTNARGSNYIPVLPNTSYTISVKQSVYQLRLSEYQSDNTHIKRNASGNNVSSYTITTSSNCYFVRWSLNYNNLTATTQEIIDSLNLQLEKGTKANSYTPYGTKPIEMCSIPNTTYKDEFKRSTGKNLAPINLESETYNSLQITNNNNGTFTLLGNPTGSFGRDIATNLTLKAGTYTISANAMPSGLYIALDNETDTQLSSSTLSKTFTLASDTTYTSLGIWFTKNKDYDVTIKLQIEEGSSVTEWQPKEGWYLHKEIGEIIFTGEESWTKTGTQGYYNNGAVFNIFHPENSSYIYGYCNKVSRQQNGFLDGQYITHVNIDKGIEFKNTNDNWGFTGSDATAFKIWLATQNIRLRYVMKTPTSEGIPSNLINQLEELYIAKSKENQTNISQINNDLGFIISASALKKGV